MNRAWILQLCLLLFSARLYAEGVVIAALGDYGSGNSNELAVANLVKSWHPDVIITLGDNSYPNDAGDRLDRNVGRFFHDYISPYHGAYGNGATSNRFFPCLGNHDWGVGDPVLNPHGADPYVAYFPLPGNRRYYTLTTGAVQLFALDSDLNEPDGNTRNSAQAEWLRKQLANSQARWKVVYCHEPPYCSAPIHGSSVHMRWPLKEWGAAVVLSGHCHVYERLMINDLCFVVCGLGGDVIDPFIPQCLRGSRVRYNAEHAALRIVATPAKLTIQLINRSGVVIDSYVLSDIPTGPG
jgi:hypothetical protein